VNKLAEPKNKPAEIKLPRYICTNGHVTPHNEADR
jgi:hypothetical protein